ncbi:hypothetical protein TNCV_5076531 [Trichonephila clavipes]|uniref:Uncharacterized protein n=1 Tax=Trichonephila clavipes TaxID=2585209 RepID=A0A8X6RVX0_TRICX|nr:hypothetical protein TNCV_5076531 [Trichonephila clavipes]
MLEEQTVRSINDAAPAELLQVGTVVLRTKLESVIHYCTLKCDPIPTSGDEVCLSIHPTTSEQPMRVIFLTTYRPMREQPLSSHPSQKCTTKIFKYELLGTPPGSPRINQLPLTLSQIEKKANVRHFNIEDYQIWG